MTDLEVSRAVHAIDHAPDPSGLCFAIGAVLGARDRESFEAGLVEAGVLALAGHLLVRGVSGIRTLN